MYIHQSLIECCHNAGTQFEGRILANEKDNPKFNFLRTADPYHAYYRHMVSRDSHLK